MGLRMFGWKNIFFKKTNHHIDEDNSAKQAQQNYTNTDTAGEQLIQQQILRYDE